MNILVETAEGIACICGDVLYDVQHQVVEPLWQVHDYEPQSTGNQGTTKRQEQAAIKKALNSGTFVLPIHDYPARSRRGRTVPGPVTLSRLGASSVSRVMPRRCHTRAVHKTVSQTGEVSHS